MDTNQKTFLFKNGSNTVQIDKNAVNVNSLIKITRRGDSFSVHVPAYNIRLYTKTRDEIKTSVHESMVSFFNYWMKIQGESKFLEQMNKLGFVLEAENDDNELEFMQNDLLEIA